jgi:hypothetical protein
MLPKILSYAKPAFRHLAPEARQEAVQNVVANTCAAVAALARRGKLDLCYPTVLAKFAVARTKDGRMLGRPLNCKDVASTYCQRQKGIVMGRLDKFDTAENEWLEIVVEDRHCGPFDIVRTRLDFAAWLPANLA